MEINQKIWSGDVPNKYPKQWIVFTEMEYDPSTYKHMGIVHFVTDSKDEAYKMAKGLKNRYANAILRRRTFTCIHHRKQNITEEKQCLV